MTKLRIPADGKFVKPNDFAPGVSGQVLARAGEGFVWSSSRITVTANAVLPNLAAQERGSCVVSLVGTPLEFVAPGMPLLVTPLEESMPPAINNGMYITCRISNLSEVRLYFIGKITTKTLPYLITVFT